MDIKFKLIEGREFNLDFLTNLNTTDFSIFENLFGDKYPGENKRDYLVKIENDNYLFVHYFLFISMFCTDWMPMLLVVFDKNRKISSYFKQDNKFGDEFETLYDQTIRNSIKKIEEGSYEF